MTSSRLSRTSHSIASARDRYTAQKTADAPPSTCTLGAVWTRRHAETMHCVALSRRSRGRGSSPEGIIGFSQAKKNVTRPGTSRDRALFFVCVCVCVTECDALECFFHELLPKQPTSTPQGSGGDGWGAGASHAQRFVVFSLPTLQRCLTVAEDLAIHPTMMVLIRLFLGQSASFGGAVAADA